MAVKRQKIKLAVGQVWCDGAGEVRVITELWGGCGGAHMVTTEKQLVEPWGGWVHKASEFKGKTLVGTL